MKDKKSAASKKAKGSGGSQRKTSKKPARAASAPRAQASGRGSIPFVCSECYEEYLLPTNYSQEAVSCPECLHVGKRPDDDFLRTVTLHKRGEKRSFASVVLAAVVLFGVVAALLWMWSAESGFTVERAQPLTLPLLGVGLLAAAIFFWLLVRFEGNRWEVYF